MVMQETASAVLAVDKEMIVEVREVREKREWKDEVMVGMNGIGDGRRA